MMPGKKTGFANSEQEAQQIELIPGLDKAHQHRHDAPRDHYASDPTASAPFFHQDASGNLQQKVPPEKDAGSEAENLVSKRQVAFHLQRCMSHVDPVEIGDDKEHEQIGHQTTHDAPARPGSDDIFNWLQVFDRFTLRINLRLRATSTDRAEIAWLNWFKPSKNTLFN